MNWSLVLAAAVALVLALGAPGADSARILVVIAMPAPSHLIVFTSLTRALAERGHHITLVCPMEKTDKLLPTHNHHIVSVKNEEVLAFKKASVKKFMTGETGNFISSMIQFFNWGPQLVSSALGHPNFVAEVNKPGQKYDLIINEAFFLQESMIALGHKFNAPVIAVNPFGASPQINEVMGNSVNPAWVPNLFLGLGGSLTFSERVLNTVASTGMGLIYNIVQLPQQQALVEEFFPTAPHISELLRDRLALVLVNNHHSLGFPTPMAPGVVEVGGMHITKKPKPLPKELKDLMDSAKDGVVYFSMGSNLEMEFMPKAKTDAIFGALGSIKQRVLIKWDGPVPDTGVPPNIHILKWAPQSDILAHPNLRVFVTHGGLLSTQEAVYHAVPLVGIPVFADQEFNMRLAVRKGFCEKVEFATISKEGLSDALQKVLGDPSYKKAVSSMSRLFRSKPSEPADLAVFWVEHILEQGTGAHLRPASVRLPLYQLLLVDVILALVTPVVVVLLLLYCCCRRFCCRSKGATSSKADRGKKTN